MNVNLIAAFVDGIAVGMAAVVIADARRQTTQAQQAAADVRARLNAAHAKVDNILAKHGGLE